MLDQVRTGDKINFVADRVNGAITVTQLEAAK
jgi:Cu/Ag efflux protein CusF